MLSVAVRPMTPLRVMPPPSPPTAGGNPAAHMSTSASKRSQRRSAAAAAVAAAAAAAAATATTTATTTTTATATTPAAAHAVPLRPASPPGSPTAGTATPVGRPVSGSPAELDHAVVLYTWHPSRRNGLRIWSAATSFYALLAGGFAGAHAVLPALPTDTFFGSFPALPYVFVGIAALGVYAARLNASATVVSITLQPGGDEMAVQVADMLGNPGRTHVVPARHVDMPTLRTGESQLEHTLRHPRKAAYLRAGTDQRLAVQLYGDGSFPRLEILRRIVAGLSPYLEAGGRRWYP